jgi:site-specific DNA-methyltransferase (adenine-specific)
MINQVIHGDCFEILKTIPDGSINAVITDPPYGIGLAEWDSVVDIPLFTKEVKRVTNGFYAFFGQMPTMVNWINSANNEKLHYCEHISWVKRGATPSPRLSRSHEDIIIYTLNKKKFYKTTGRYEDVKLPGVLVDAITLEGIDRYIKDLRLKLKTRDNYNHRTQSGSKLPEYKRFASPGDSSPEFANFTNVWSFLPSSQSKRPGYQNNPGVYHPTGKPLEIMKRLVEMLTPEGGTVLDPFAGSGTTALACKELGRNYICIEKEREYIDIIHQRLNTPIAKRGLTVEEQVEIEEKIKPPYQQLSLF